MSVNIPHLHAGQRHDRGRNELEAGRYSTVFFSRQRPCANPDVAKTRHARPPSTEFPFPSVRPAPSFGVLGANVPRDSARVGGVRMVLAFKRGLAGEAINAIARRASPEPGHISLTGPAVCFAAFPGLLNVLVILRGNRKPFVSCKVFPLHFLLLIGPSAAFSGARGKAGGFGSHARYAFPSFRISANSFAFFIPSLTGVVGFWGHRIAEYSRFYSLRAKPARPDDWPGARPGPQR